MCSLVQLFAQLRLRVNESKSAVAPAQERDFLGFCLWTWKGTLRLGVSSKALRAMKDRIRAITRRVRGRSLHQVVLDLRSYLLGWWNYFQISESPRLARELDGWIRHRLRAYQLKQWRNRRTIYRELVARGLTTWDAFRVARCEGRWWRSSGLFLNRALPNLFFDGLGVPRLTQ